jgi:hypothetical protein
VNAIHKRLSTLKNVLQKPHKAFQGFGTGSTELHAKLDADTLLDFVIHHRQSMQSKKHSCRNNARSQSSVMWQTDATGLRKCDIGLPSHLLSPWQLQQ